MAEPDQPRLQCDLVMRGGITSGIVYPLAVAELSKTYDFRSIGGTSAGAIAAAVTAAAAYGCRNDNETAFKKIAGIPELLGTSSCGQTRLEQLFQPNKGTSRLFRIVKSIIAPPQDGSVETSGAVRNEATSCSWNSEHESTEREASSFSLCEDCRNPQQTSPEGTKKSASGVLLTTIRVLFAVGAAYLPSALTGAIPGVFLILLSGIILLDFPPLRPQDYAFATLIALLGLAAAVLGLLIDAVRLAYKDVNTELHRNMYGLCSGMPDENAENGSACLTPWLHSIIQDLAKRSVDGAPLTVGELWGDTANRHIELQLVTTNITLGQPRTFPAVEGTKEEIYFNVEEFRRLFPASVVDHMVSHGRKRCSFLKASGETVYEFCRLPEPKDMPVIFGARLSLSFPILISAIPLYHAEKSESSNCKERQLRCCWYSDGGLTSNFPVHMFDSPLPMRPTFGINLAYSNVKGMHRAARCKNWENISMPEVNEQPDTLGFNLFDQEELGSDPMKRFSSVKGFLSAIFSASQNWQDSKLMAMPGYQDRIVTVHLKENEGGYRLNMSRDVIVNVAERGRRAGKLLAARFSAPPNTQRIDPSTGKTVRLNWENHRRIRLRSTLAALETYAHDLVRRWDNAYAPPPGQIGYSGFAKQDDADYPWSDGETRLKSFALIDELMAAFRKTSAKPVLDSADEDAPIGSGRSPRPKAELRLRPPDT